MRKLSTLLLVLACWCFHPAFASDHAALYQRLVEINGWVRAETGYASKELPKVVFKSNEEMAAMAGSNPCTSDPDYPCVKAAQAGGVIFLMDDFVLGQDDYILAHELTHFQQWESGKRFMCNGEKEAEAYKVQAEFVAQTRSGKAANAMLVLLVSQCGG